MARSSQDLIDATSNAVCLHFHNASLRLALVKSGHIWGTVVKITQSHMTIAGLASHQALRGRVHLLASDSQKIICEIIALRDGMADIVPIGRHSGIGCTTKARSPIDVEPETISVGYNLLGRVMDPLGRPIDGLGPIGPGDQIRPLHAEPPAVSKRARLGHTVELGVSVIDVFTPCRDGQRLGIFAGAGVGKSTLVGMLARFSEFDIIVVALVGERGKEVREFLEDELDEPGRAKSVVVVATSDQVSVVRRMAAYTAVTISEYFRDDGARVLLLFDSLTRFCMALKEISIAAGDSSGSRGYPVTVFSELPQLLERVGPGYQSAGNQGSITGIFTVLRGDIDTEDTLPDTIQSLLDGHIILDKRIAERGRFPAVDIIRSLSRTGMTTYTPTEAKTIERARDLLVRSAELADLVRFGAYQVGNDTNSDRALIIAEKIENLFVQDRYTRLTGTQQMSRLVSIMGDQSE